MLDLVHSVQKAEIPARDTRPYFDTEEDWENAIYEAMNENVALMEVMDLVHRYRTWLKIDTYREVSRMLAQNNDGRYARQKIAFFIKREQR